MVVARTSTIFVILVATQGWKYRPGGLPRTTGCIRIEVGEDRAPAYRWRAFSFDINVIVVVGLGARDSSLSLEGTKWSEDELSGLDLLGIELKLLDNGAILLLVPLAPHLWCS